VFVCITLAKNTLFQVSKENDKMTGDEIPFSITRNDKTTQLGIRVF
jgi:hypothetical protein